jgi:diaminopimelate epimerase
MHGLGNDFVVVDDVARAIPEASLPEISRKLNDRHFGVGGDGLILIRPSVENDFQMRMFNPDGTEAEMCGNGIRCFAVYIAEHGLSAKNPLRADTGAGTLILNMEKEGDRVVSVRVDMGAPRNDKTEVPMQGAGPAINVPLCLEGREFLVNGVSMGNPHAVIFLDTLEGFPVEQFGPLVERNPLFPEKANVHFVEQVGANELKMRIWERGAGLTLACGTGACASTVAAVLTGRTGRDVKVNLPGGQLRIEWDEATNHVFMTGPAVEVFAGETDPEFL